MGEVGIEKANLLPLLKWYQVKGADGMNVAKAKEEWQKLHGKSPPSYTKWTDADEEMLVDLSKPITIRDTALGRRRDEFSREFMSGVFPNLTREEKEKMMNEMADSIKNGDDVPMGSGISIMPNLDSEKAPSAAPVFNPEQLPNMSNNATTSEGMMDCV